MQGGFLTSLIAFDHWLFQQINSQWTNGVFDVFFPFLTDLNRQHWIVPVVLLLFAIWIAMKKRRALVWIVILFVSVGTSDLINYRVLKSTAQRDRPEQAGVPVVLRTAHHSGTSFPSNHASNAFAGASTLAAAFPPAAPYLYAVAALIAYSRVYVGVHFPSDVIAGAFIGWLIAFIVRLLLIKFIERGETK